LNGQVTVLDVIHLVNISDVGELTRASPQ
jgi:hypothetical protein